MNYKETNKSEFDIFFLLTYDNFFTTYIFFSYNSFYNPYSLLFSCVSFPPEIKFNLTYS